MSLCCGKCKPRKRVGSNLDCDYHFKVLVIGDAGVGKTSLLDRFADDRFTERYSTSLVVDFKIRHVEAVGKDVKLQVWDTASQERFPTITLGYYRNAQGVIVVYDVTNQESYDNVQYWLQEVDKYSSKDVKKLLIGNKSDMSETRVVDYKKVKKQAAKWGLTLIETSAKMDTNVWKAFKHMATQLVKQTKKSEAKVEAKLSEIEQD